MCSNDAIMGQWGAGKGAPFALIEAFQLDADSVSPAQNSWMRRGKQRCSVWLAHRCTLAGGQDLEVRDIDGALARQEACLVSLHEGHISLPPHDCHHLLLLAADEDDLHAGTSCAPVDC